MTSPRVGFLITSTTVFLLWTTGSGAAVCNVPSGPHPTIQVAIGDVGCTELILAAQTFVESVEIARTLTITGASTTTTIVEGHVAVTGVSTEITLSNMTIDATASTAGCYSEALDVSGGGRVTSNALIAINGDGAGTCPLFSDGFESGSTSAWSMATP